MGQVVKLSPLVDVTPAQRTLILAATRTRRRYRPRLADLVLVGLSGSVVGFVCGVYICRVVLP